MLFETISIVGPDPYLMSFEKVIDILRINLLHIAGTAVANQDQRHDQRPHQEVQEVTPVLGLGDKPQTRKSNTSMKSGTMRHKR